MAEIFIFTTFTAISFIIGDNKLRLPKIREQYQGATEPKEFVILNGSAHAQFIFKTDQGDRLMREILRFLSAP